MTTSYLDPAPAIDLARTSLRSSARAWDDALVAALAHDARLARRVLGGDAARRSGLRSLRRRLDLCAAVDDLQSSRLLVDDLWRIDRLLVQLAQDVLGPGAGLPIELVAEVEVVRSVGVRRLRGLARTLPAVPIDAAYVKEGRRVVQAWTVLHEHNGGETAVCGRLAAVLVETSRHASGTV